MMNLSDIWPYVTFTIGFGIGFICTRGNVKNTLLSVEIKLKEAEVKQKLVDTAKTIAKTEEGGGSVKIRSKTDQAIAADQERARVRELLADD